MTSVTFSLLFLLPLSPGTCWEDYWLTKMNSLALFSLPFTTPKTSPNTNTSYLLQKKHHQLTTRAQLNELNASEPPTALLPEIEKPNLLPRREVNAVEEAAACGLNPSKAYLAYCDQIVAAKCQLIKVWKRTSQYTPFFNSLKLNWKIGTSEENNNENLLNLIDRRQVLLSTVASSVGFLLNGASLTAPPAIAASSSTGFADMPALRGKDYGKSKMRYPDYTETESGLQFKDLRMGTGPTPKIGDTVVVDWDGYTIGYYGRIFEARNKTKGGSFEGDDKDFFKFKIGFDEVIPAFEEAVASMSLGGIRRIIVPPELGYPENDYNKKGPKPATFSGQRALDFVLRNQGLIDKTLLFDIELIKIIPN